MTVCDKEMWTAQEIVTAFECPGGNLDFKIELSNASYQNGDYYNSASNPDRLKPSNPITCSDDLTAITTDWYDNNCCTHSSSLDVNNAWTAYFSGDIPVEAVNFLGRNTNIGFS